MGLAEVFAKVRLASVGICLKEENDVEVRFKVFGSGACVDPSGIIVTAKHLVMEKDPSQLAILFTKRASTKYQVLYAQPMAMMAQEEEDVAFIKVPEFEGGWPSFDLPDEWTTREGDEIATIGYPLRRVRELWDYNAIPQLFSGVVSQVADRYVEHKRGWLVKDLVLDISVHPGNSGGPVFNADNGKLIGIISWQRSRELDFMNQVSDEQDAYVVWTNITYAVPWTSFVTGIDELKKRTRA